MDISTEVHPVATLLGTLSVLHLVHSEEKTGLRPRCTMPTRAGCNKCNRSTVDGQFTYQRMSYYKADLLSALKG